MQAHLRFYEELNDLLPPARRKRAFAFACFGKTTLRQVLAALNIPISSVDLILADGKSVGLSHVIKENEWISFYPVFERFDIGSVQRVRSRPLRRTRFAVSPGLSHLAAFLCFLGFDTVQIVEESTENLVAQVEKEKRILLTLDRRLQRRGLISRALCLTKSEPARQLLEVLSRLDLWRDVAPDTRRLFCNRPMGVSKAVGSTAPSLKY
jgi:hypothetical protein